MKKLLFKNTSHQSMIKHIKEAYLLHYLQRQNAIWNKERGHRMAVYANDWIGAHIYTQGIYEKENIQDTLMLFQILNIQLHEATAIDIGANIGNHTLAFAKHFKHVIAFEANPHTFKLLDFNTSYCHNIDIHNIGLGNQCAKIRLFEDPNNFGGTSAIQNHFDQYIETDIKPLDKFLDKLINIKLIKIDVEGMEYQVLLGAQKVIEKYQPLIVFEQLEKEFSSSKESASICFLRQMGYTLYWVESNRDQSMHWLIRRFKNLYEFFTTRSETRSIVSGNEVPCRTHNILFAIPSDMTKNL